MANCHNLFQHFNQVIRLGDQEWVRLLGIRDNLRQRMRLRYDTAPHEVTSNHRLQFQTQGSVVMDTIIRPHDDDYDLDDGVYFIGRLSRERRPKPEVFHQTVMYLVGQDEHYGQIEDRDACVRVKYTNDEDNFHIDLPIYYADNQDAADLAHKKDDWTISNPVEFIDWFERLAQSGFQKGFILNEGMYDPFQKWLSDIRKADVQLRRIVRYLKAWGDTKRQEMPSGIIMTILAATNFKSDVRDDIAMHDTLVGIQDYLDNNGFTCPRPTTPDGEDLFASYSSEKKDYFARALSAFVSAAGHAIANNNQKESCLKWQRHLGYRFPCQLAKDEVEGAKQHSRPAIIGDTARSA